MSVFIIAEAGVNHNGSIENAKKMIEKAKLAGADCIKFQTYITENLVKKNAEKAEYQKINTSNNESQFSMLKRLELSFEDFFILQEYCKQNEIMFMSTPFDQESIDFLDSLGMEIWKIPSGEINNYPYIKRIASIEKKIILSTGMCNLEMVDEAYKLIRKYNREDIVMLHCTTQYPTPYSDVNLLAMETLKREFKCKVGYSDHTQGIEVPIAATALGACVIEKHFTLDRCMDGPDHKASIEPDELKQMVTGIRNIEQALGNGRKILTESELPNIVVARKSIVAKKNICKGEYFSEDNLTTKRPGNGISPMRWEELIGKKALRDYIKDEMIEV